MSCNLTNGDYIRQDLKDYIKQGFSYEIFYAPQQDGPLMFVTELSFNKEIIKQWSSEDDCTIVSKIKEYIAEKRDSKLKDIGL